MALFKICFSINFLLVYLILKPLVYTLCILGIVYISCVNFSTNRFKKTYSLIHLLFIWALCNFRFIFWKHMKELQVQFIWCLGHGFVSGEFIFMYWSSLMIVIQHVFIASYSGLTQNYAFIWKFFWCFYY